MGSIPRPTSARPSSPATTRATRIPVRASGAQLGWGPVPWLFIGGLAAASTHEATVGPTPSGQYFQLYRLGGELRIAAHVGQVGFFLAPAGGYAILSSNLLDEAGVTKTDSNHALFIGGSGGLEWRTQNPRFAFGLAGEADVIPDFNLTAVSVQFYLRYTKTLW